LVGDSFVSEPRYAVLVGVFDLTAPLTVRLPEPSTAVTAVLLAISQGGRRCRTMGR
jgi:hypothetical protein